MTTKRMQYELTEFKALPAVTGMPEGRFSALVSTFGNVDYQGDIVMKGAFDNDIANWRKSGDPLPLIWSHDWGNPYAHIGSVDPKNIVETDDGLLIKDAQLDIDTNPFAAQVYELLSKRRVKEFSFGYEVIREKRNKDGANELHELRIVEAGPTLKGANPQALLQGVKAAPLSVEDIEDTKSGAEIRAELMHNTKAEVDNSEWDANAAMTACSSASDYKAICAGERPEGDPDERSHWALPHHKTPGGPPNAAGVRAALAALGGARGGEPNLKNVGGARSHLEAHMKTINPDYEAASDEPATKTVTVTDDDGNVYVGLKAGRVLSAKNEDKLRRGVALITEVLGAVQDGEETGSNTDSETKGAEVQTVPDGGETNGPLLSLKTRLMALED